MSLLRQAALYLGRDNLRADQDRAVEVFLAIYLVTSSKGGISAMELQRQMGFGSYGTVWSWLHKIRRALVRPDREPLPDRVAVDETLVGGARPGKSGRGANGKTVVAGACPLP